MWNPFKQSDNTVPSAAIQAALGAKGAGDLTGVCVALQKGLYDTRKVIYFRAYRPAGESQAQPVRYGDLAGDRILYSGFTEQDGRVVLY